MCKLSSDRALYLISSNTSARSDSVLWEHEAEGSNPSYSTVCDPEEDEGLVCGASISEFKARHTPFLKRDIVYGLSFWHKV